MNILLLIEGTYPWYRGGVSEWVYQYLKHLPEFRFTILQIATDEFHNLNPEEALYPLTDNVDEFIRVPPPDMRGGDYNEYLETWYDSISETSLSFDDNFHALHVTNTGFAGWLGAKISRSMDIPMILTEHAIYWKEVEMGAVALECGYKIPASKDAKADTVSSFKHFASLTYSSANQIVTVSQSNIPYQQNLGALDIQYIPNGIPSSWLVEDKNRGDNPVIGWVGRCAEMKNPLAFFDFIEQFRDIDLDPEFIMLLSDANEKELAEEVKKRAKEFPEVTCVWNQPAKEYFKNLDLLAITSHNESQPLVMLEALAHKALPVGYKVGDLTGKFGLVIEKGEPISELVKEIVLLWNNQSEFERIVSKRFEMISSEHTWENIFSSYEQLMVEVSELEVFSGSE